MRLVERMTGDAPIKGALQKSDIWDIRDINTSYLGPLIIKRHIQELHRGPTDTTPAKVRDTYFGAQQTGTC